MLLVERLAGAAIAIACVLAGLKYALARAGIVAGRPFQRRDGGGTGTGSDTGTGSKSRGRKGRVLAVLENAYLPGAASLHLVRAGTRLLVVGRSGGGLVTLCELEEGADSHCR